MKSILYYIIPINLLFDMFSLFFETGGTLAIIRAGFLYCFVFYVIVTSKKGNSFISIFILYIILLMPFSSNILYSVRVSLQIFISLLMFIVSFSIIRSEEDLFRLNSQIPIYIFLLGVNYLLSNYFNLGGSIYSNGGDFQTGNLEDSWNNYTYALLLVPLVSSTLKSKFYQKILITVSLLLIIMVVLSLKRVAIGGLFLGGGIYYFIAYDSKKVIKIGLMIGIVLILLFPLYGNLLEYRFTFREDKLYADTYLHESRYLETIIVWEEILSFENIEKSIFGLEAFNSIGTYGNGIFGKRQLHVDYNLIAYSNGLLGLFLYLLIYFSIYYEFNKYKKQLVLSNGLYKKLYALFYTLLFMSLFTSFAGQMYSITFRSIIFIYLGAITSIFRQKFLQSRQKFLQKVNENTNSM